MSIKIQILVDNDSWIIPYAKRLNTEFCEEKHASQFINSTKLIEEGDILFLLGCHTILPKHILQKNKHNIVIHESNLPEGKGWSPMTWQIIEGKNKIPISLFEATENIDAGVIYIRDKILLDGTELIKDWQLKLGNKTVELCKTFISQFPNNLKPEKQNLNFETFYSRRRPEDSKLNIYKSLNDQFNLLRTVDNNRYPAYFEKNGIKYIISIEKDDK